MRPEPSENMLSLKASHAGQPKSKEKPSVAKERHIFRSCFLGVWQHKGVDTFCVDSYWGSKPIFFPVKHTRRRV